MAWHDRFLATAAAEVDWLNGEATMRTGWDVRRDEGMRPAAASKGEEQNFEEDSMAYYYYRSREMV